MLNNTKPFQALANAITGELRYDFKAANAYAFPILYWANKGLEHLCTCDVNAERLTQLLNGYKKITLR